MKIQLANRTYQQTNDCCLFCAFNENREYFGSFFRIRCTLPTICTKKAFSRRILNDEIFKL